jgi:hypothetical protein
VSSHAGPAGNLSPPGPGTASPRYSECSAPTPAGRASNHRVTSSNRPVNASLPAHTACGAVPNVTRKRTGSSMAECLSGQKTDTDIRLTGTRFPLRSRNAVGGGANVWVNVAVVPMKGAVLTSTGCLRMAVARRWSLQQPTSTILPRIVALPTCGPCVRAVTCTMTLSITLRARRRHALPGSVRLGSRLCSERET